MPHPFLHCRYDLRASGLQLRQRNVGLLLRLGFCLLLATFTGVPLRHATPAVMPCYACPCCAARSSLSSSAVCAAVAQPSINGERLRILPHVQHRPLLCCVPSNMPRAAHAASPDARRFNTDHVKAGSPWGAGTFAGADGSRQPTEVELAYAKHQVGKGAHMHIAGSCQRGMGCLGRRVQGTACCAVLCCAVPRCAVPGTHCLLNIHPQSL